MNVDELSSKLSQLEILHRKFESKFPLLYRLSGEDLRNVLSELYDIASEKLSIAMEVSSALAGVGGSTAEKARDLYRNEHQMKFRLEELMSISSEDFYEGRLKLKTSLDRLVHFHRVYDYTFTTSLRDLKAAVDLLTLAGNGEQDTKASSGILERLEEIDRVRERLDKLVRLTARLYFHPGDVYKVEDSLIEWHRKGLMWVEARNVEKISGVRDAAEILEGLTLIGVVERKKRGGESVYRHRRNRAD
ncbi:MAG: hypothetical protein GXO14_04870 [Thermococci archaeon]|nr:hypothetical protein [Thermococci archaeon]